MSKFQMAALAALFTLAFAPCAIAAPSGLTLERVVVVQRHGVRPPTSSNAELAHFAAQPWPSWPVPTGELTPHGAEVVRLMGLSLGRTYRAAGLLPERGCPAAGEAASRLTRKNLRSPIVSGWAGSGVWRARRL